MAAGDTYPLGDGTLHVGQTGTPIDVSCLVNSARITATKEQADATTKLCGTVKQSKPAYTFTLAGNIDTDIDDPAGLWALSQLAKGTEVDFTFVPNTDAGTEASGVIVIDPLDFGGEEYGVTMASDFEWTLTGEPAYEVAGAPLVPAPVVAALEAAGLDTVVSGFRAAADDLDDLTAVNQRVAQVIVDKVTPGMPRATGAMVAATRAVADATRAAVVVGVRYARPRLYGSRVRGIPPARVTPYAALMATAGTWMDLYTAAVSDACDNVKGK